MSIEEIFDITKYNKMRAVTYSASPNFLNKYLIDFDSVEIVVGINEDRVQSAVNDIANNIKSKVLSSICNEPIKYYENLDINLKNKLNEKSFDIKVPLGFTIHSKFYLLENTKTLDNRVILGSANLSEHAFSNKSNQFENIIIYDNSPLYDIQDELYKSYEPYLTHYFPKDLYKRNMKLTSTDIAVFLSNEDVDQIQRNSIIDDIENVKDKIALAILPPDTLEQMRNIDLGREEMISNNKQQVKYEEAAYQIVKESINTRTNKSKIKEKASIKKTVENNIKPLKVKTSQNSLERDAIYSKVDLRNTDADRSGLLIKSQVNDTYMNLGEYADIDTIRNGLIQIDKFIKTFENYSTKYTDEYGQRIMEVILYSFSSPFLYEIKKLARTNEERLDVPQFLFIGGAAGSGKSSLIKMISKMLGVSNIPYHNYADLGDGHRAKSERKNTLEAWANEENVYPIIVDELPIEFFSNENYGKSLIMNLANRNVLTVNPFPTIIATTNADSYTLPEEARRRSYYLKIDKVFSDDFRKDSPLAYIDIYENMDSSLFKDYIMQMSKRLENKDDYEWNHFADGVSKVDFLYQTREILNIITPSARCHCLDIFLTKGIPMIMKPIRKNGKSFIRELEMIILNLIQ